MTFHHQIIGKIRGNGSNIMYVLLILLFLSMLGPQRMSYNVTYAIAALWAIQGGFSKVKKNLVNFPILWLLFSLFFIQVIGLAYSDNFRMGRIALEQRLSFIAFPLILFSSTPLSRKQLNRLFSFFCYGWFFWTLMSLYLAYQENLAVNGGWALESFWLFSHHQLTKSMGHTAINTALFIGFCILWLYKELLFHWAKLSWKLKGGYVFLFIYFMSYQVLLAARTIFFAVIAIIFLGSLYWFFKHKQWQKALIALLLIPSLTLGALSTHPTTWARFSDVTKFGEPMEKTNFGGYQLRLKIWESAWQVIQQHPILGVGTGDVWEPIVEVHKQKGFEEGIKHKYHAHNQYLQDWMAMGIFGIAILLANLFIPAWIAFRRKQYFYLAFLSFIAMSCMTDITLGFYRGILFFAVVNALLLYQTLQPHNDASH